MEKNQLDLSLIRLNILYNGTKKFTSKNNYSDIIIFIMACLDVDNKKLAARLLNSYILEIPDGKERILAFTLAYDHYKLFDLLNELYGADVDNSLIYNAMKNKSTKIIDHIRRDSSKYNINISQNNYRAIQLSILELDDKEYLSVFTSVIRLFNERSKLLSFSKVSLIYNCFIKDAIFNEKWFFLAIILSYYGELCERELNSDDMVASDLNDILFNSYLVTLNNKEQSRVLNELNSISVIKNYLLQ